MTFQETLFELCNETKKTTIFGLISLGDGSHGIGFRRACVGSDLKDILIDGIVFMLCADAWNSKLTCNISTTEELVTTNKEDVEIRLRAVSLTYPSAVIQLGNYKIVNMKVEKYEDIYYLSGPVSVPSRVRLDIERIR